MRFKGRAHDYRYFPRPRSAAYCVIEQAWVDDNRVPTCPNCPTPRKRALSMTLGLSDYDAWF